MPCYMIVRARIADRVLGGATTVLEGPWPADAPEPKTVISVWPDRAAAEAFWQSPEYRAACELREGAGEFAIQLVDGLPGASPP